MRSVRTAICTCGGARVVLVHAGRRMTSVFFFAVSRRHGPVSVTGGRVVRRALQATAVVSVWVCYVERERVADVLRRPSRNPGTAAAAGRDLSPRWDIRGFSRRGRTLGRRGATPGAGLAAARRGPRSPSVGVVRIDVGERPGRRLASSVPQVGPEDRHGRRAGRRRPEACAPLREALPRALTSSSASHEVSALVEVDDGMRRAAPSASPKARASADISDVAPVGVEREARRRRGSPLVAQDRRDRRPRPRPPCRSARTSAARRP